MGFFNSFHKHRARLSVPETVATLSEMETFFQNGANWTQNEYHAANGTKCLVGAADHVRISPVDDAKYWLRQAIAESAPEIKSIERFNDSRRSYGEVAAVIARAKQLAASALLPVPAPAAPDALPWPKSPEVVETPLYAPARSRTQRRSLMDWLD